LLLLELIISIRRLPWLVHDAAGKLGTPLPPLQCTQATTSEEYKGWAKVQRIIKG